MDTTETSDKKPQLTSGIAGTQQQLTQLAAVEKLEIEILPVIYEIIRGYVLLSIFVAIPHNNNEIRMHSIEKDPTDNAAKQRESQDCSQKVSQVNLT